MPCPELFQSLSMRENYTTHLEHVHRFSLPTDRRAQLETGCWAGATEWHVSGSILNTCCVSSNTPLRLSSSGTPFHRQLFLFCSFLCLVQTPTSLNNWPWLYFTAEHILRFCTLVRSVKDQSHVKVPFDHVIKLFKLYPLTAFSCTSSRNNLPYIWHNVV